MEPGQRTVVAARAGSYSIVFSFFSPCPRCLRFYETYICRASGDEEWRRTVIEKSLFPFARGLLFQETHDVSSLWYHIIDDAVICDA